MRSHVSQYRRPSFLVMEGLGGENNADDEEIPEHPDSQEAEMQEEERHQIQQHNSADDVANTSSTRPVPEAPRLHSTTLGLLTSIASTARDCIWENSPLAKITTGVHPVLRSLVDGLAIFFVEEHQVELSTSTQGLVLAAKRCQAVEILDASIQLNYWVNVIILASQVTRYVGSNFDGWHY